MISIFRDFFLLIFLNKICNLEKNFNYIYLLFIGNIEDLNIFFGMKKKIIVEFYVRGDCVD